MQCSGLTRTEMMSMMVLELLVQLMRNKKSFSLYVVGVVAFSLPLSHLNLMASPNPPRERFTHSFEGFSDIKSFSYVSEMEVLSQVGEKDKKFLRSLEYKYMGGNFSYAIFHQSLIPNPDRDALIICNIAYQKPMFQFLVPDNRMLVITSKSDIRKMKYDTHLVQDLGIFEPYRFSLSGTDLISKTASDLGVNPWDYVPMLNDFSDQKNWIKVTDTAVFVKDEVGKRVFRFPGRSKPEVEVFYEVEFDKAREFYPISWVKTSNKIKDESYQITEFHEVQMKRGMVYFPKKAIRKIYDRNGEVSTVATCTIKNLKVNQSDESDTDFSIDPSLADIIYDIDADRYINVPK